jgi:hypothetical protein
MGCDIHIYTEKLVEFENNLSKWINCDNWRYNEYYNPKDKDGETKMNIHPIYMGRDYELFSVLANVRNYSDDNLCISEPKGLPKDICKITKAEAKRWKGDAHSHSYLTFKEIKDFRAKKYKRKFSGLVSKYDAQLLDEGKGFPKCWTKGADPSLGLVHREWEEETDVLYKLTKGLDERKRDEFWIFDKEEHAELDEKIRIVFWFDN